MSMKGSRLPSTPPGTRDVLPDEMEERQLIVRKLSEAFKAAGYRSCSTPTLELAETAALAGTSEVGDAAKPLFKTTDERGHSMVLRSDMTSSIARLVASRFSHQTGPFRLSYVDEISYRSVKAGRGEAKELSQAGVELCGVGHVDGTAEVIELASTVIDSFQLAGAKVVLGDANFFELLLNQFAVPDEAAKKVLFELKTDDFVGVDRELQNSCDIDTANFLFAISRMRGDSELLQTIAEPKVRAAGDSIAELVDKLSDSAKAKVVIDLGMTKKIGYYTGTLFEMYAPGQGAPIGSGGRYDDLLGRYGRDMPAVGFALDIEALHASCAALRSAEWSKVEDLK